MEPKLPTIKEIAKRLNISASTVSRSLHDHPGIGLRTKMQVQKMAKEINYEPNQTAIFFKQRKTFTLGVILPELSEAFFSSAISGIEDCAYKNNYTVLMGQSHNSEEKEKLLIETMKNHRVDGLVISIAKNTTHYEQFESLKRYNIPVVFFNRIPNIPNIHYVACNLVPGTVQAINFLFKKGHRVIGMINGPEKLNASQERREGYIQAITKSRLKFHASLIVNSDLSAASTFEATKELLSSRLKPTAIVTFNDYVAMDAAKYARLQKKLRINKEICFVSYENQSWNGYTAFPPIAALEQFPYLQGQKAVETLLELFNKREFETDNNHTYHKIIIESELTLNNNNK